MNFSLQVCVGGSTRGNRVGQGALVVLRAVLNSPPGWLAEDPDKGGLIERYKEFLCAVDQAAVAEGGRFSLDGDRMTVVFSAPHPQPESSVVPWTAAVQCAMRIQRTHAQLQQGNQDVVWPKLCIGIAGGPGVLRTIEAAQGGAPVKALGYEATEYGAVRSFHALADELVRDAALRHWGKFILEISSGQQATKHSSASADLTQLFVDRVHPHALTLIDCTSWPDLRNRVALEHPTSPLVPIDSQHGRRSVAVVFEAQSLTA